ncbi:MAG: VUT family protein [Trueperaceae bacterium]|nr:VUT family protein [Trueperaceae bacterium]
MTAPTPAAPRRSDRLRLLALPALVTVGAGALLWMSGFGATPPDRLPIATLVFLGALFGDALARSLIRTGRSGTAFLAAGLAFAAVLAAFGVPVRDLVAPFASALLGVALAAVPERQGHMVGAMSVYAAATLLANYTLDAFLPVGPWFLVNVGTLFFGVTFTQRDRVHRYGRRAVYAMIFAAAVMNVAAALSVGTPLRYVAVSFLAIVVSEAADTEVYQRLVRRRWLVRVLSSNAVSAPIDTILFTVLAFAGAPFATAGWMVQVIVTDVMVKYGSGFLTALALLRDRTRPSLEPT